jgi:two-component system, LytTR family, sensor kinase
VHLRLTSRKLHTMKLFKVESVYLALHFFIWILLFCMPFIFFGYKEFLLLKSTFHLVLLVPVFYLNMWVLIPQLIFEKRIVFYAISVIVIMIFAGITTYFFDTWLFRQYSLDVIIIERAHQSIRPRIDLAPAFLSTIMILGISTSLRLIDEYRKQEKNKKEIQSEKLNSELAFLKSQVNPHFLFNTLNNLYSLARSGSPKVSQAILKLSDLMHYMLEETQENKISLHKEVQYLINYIELQKIRLHESVSVIVNIQKDIPNESIVPLLLIPFVENAFKHGVSYNQKSFINIDLAVKNQVLLLTVLNSKIKGEIERDSVSGIGLNNVNRRLNLLYPDQYKLSIRDSDTDYMISLSINL